MLKAKTIEETCFACPSSWSGELEDGRVWRARYRWGWLRFTVDKDPNKMSVFSYEEPEVLECFQIGGEYDGSMSYDEMKDHLKHLIDLEYAEWVDNGF